MNRQKLLNALLSHRPADPHEEAMLRQLLDFVGQHENCFDRSLLIGHITGSAWVVDRGREHVLLTHHHKLNKWLQLGGHADGEPDVLSVALREAREESGLESLRPVSESIFDVDVHEIPTHGGEPAHLHYDVRFLLEADLCRPLSMSPESKALAWIRLSEVPGLTREESILRMVRKTRDPLTLDPFDPLPL